MRRVLAAVFVALYAATAVGVEVLTRVIPVVGSTPGNFGSFFRTELQFRNGGGADLTGRFVFHPNGRAAQAGDPSMPFTLDSDQTVSWSDVVDAMGITGLGSLDLMLPARLVLAGHRDARVQRRRRVGHVRIHRGRRGPAQRGSGSPVLTGGTTGILVAPADLTRYRFNIGIRALSSGVGCLITVRSADGTSVHGELRSYDPIFFEQTSAADFANVPIHANDSIEISVSRGSAVIYGATTDNTTNDPSFQYARVVPRTN
jgi:hypothetical protein